MRGKQPMDCEPVGVASTTLCPAAMLKQPRPGRGTGGHAAGRNPLGERLIDLFGGEVALKIASIVVAGVLSPSEEKENSKYS